MIKKSRRSGFISTTGKHTPKSLGKDLKWHHLSDNNKTLSDFIFNNAEILSNHDGLTRFGIKVGGNIFLKLIKKYVNGLVNGKDRDKTVILGFKNKVSSLRSGKREFHSTIVQLGRKVLGWTQIIK